MRREGREGVKPIGEESYRQRETGQRLEDAVPALENGRRV